MVCLSAGDINTGNFDDFRTVIPLCRSRGNTWVHVDGAFGLWAKVSPHFAHLLEGVEGADSWATDAHKWLNTPFDIGFVAVRHPEAHRAAMSVRAPYLTHAATARDQIDWNPEWSRRGRGVPVYAAVKALGRRGIAEIVERCSEAAASLVEGIGSLPGAEVLSPAIINQGLVRFRDPAGTDHDGFTDRVIAAIQAEGTAWFGGTDWHDMRAMRISVCSWATGPADVRNTLHAVERVLTALEIENERHRRERGLARYVRHCQATSCCLIQSRRAWSIRVCQPRPPARKWSMTSWDNRIVVDTFGRALGGRPRRTGALANFSGQPSFERSGAVSGSKPRAVEPSFSFIGPPHADDPVYVVAACPDEDHHRFVQKADGDVANLAVVLPVVFDGQRSAGEHLLRVGHVQPSGLDRLRALGLLEFDPHD